MPTTLGDQKFMEMQRLMSGSAGGCGGAILANAHHAVHPPTEDESKVIEKKRNEIREIAQLAEVAQMLLSLADLADAERANAIADRSAALGATLKAFADQTKVRYLYGLLESAVSCCYAVKSLTPLDFISRLVASAVAQ